jgi:hypothetical protein
MMAVLTLTAILALAIVSPVAADNASIGVKIGVPAPPRVVVMPPPPPVALVAPPKLVVVPGSPVFLAVPVAYYKIPPGHAKKMGGHGCPPGLAKQGRC